MKQSYLECGRVLTTHGVRGAVKIEPWCDSPRQLAALKTVYLRAADGTFSPKMLRNPSVSGDRVIAYIGECASIDDALLLRGKTLYASREELSLPKGRVFLADLIGLPVTDADTGRVYGKIKDVSQMPSSDMYLIETKAGDVLFPAVEEFVVRVDLEEGVFLRPIPGFFEEES